MRTCPICLPGGPQVVASAEIAVNLHLLDDGVAAHLVNYGYDDEHDAVADDPRAGAGPPVAGEDLATAEVVRPGRPPEPVT